MIQLFLHSLFYNLNGEIHIKRFTDLTMKRTILFILISVAAASLPTEMAAALNEYRNMEVHLNSSQQKKEKKKGKKGAVTTPPLQDLKDIPRVTFTAADPCAPGNQVTEGMPWEKTNPKEIKLTGGVEPMIPEPLPSITHLSAFDYKAALSVAFEGMRLIYGPMPEEEGRQFEQTWAPLFNYPTQEIIDYLNRLNPLISQFLAARESYLRTLAAVQLVMLDAATAVDWDDQEAFHAALFEAKMHTTGLESLNAAMQELANRIQQLGNPPNPNDAKCEAYNRYRRIFQKDAEDVYLGESWIGTRKSPYQAGGLDELKETLIRYLFRTKVNGKDHYYAIQLIESDPCSDEEMEADEACLSSVKVEQLDLPSRSDQKPDITSDGTFVNYLPKVPVMLISKLTFDYFRLREYSGLTDADMDNPGLVADKEAYKAACNNYGTRIMRSGFFFKTAIEWSAENRWSQYTFNENGVMPDNAIEDFEEAVRASISADMAAQKKSKKQRREEEKSSQLAKETEERSAREKEMQDSLALEKQSREESIASRREIIATIREQIDREREYKQRASERLSQVKSPQEAASIRKEMADIDMRIISFQSTMQGEEDAVTTLQTGEVVHTRTVYQDYTHSKMIHDMHIDAARRDATRRAAYVVDHQIRRLPPAQRETARRLAESVIDGDALVSGDVEKARSLALALNKQLQGYGEYDHAVATEAIVNSEENEFWAQSTIVAAGAISVGLGSSALAGAYGAEAAATIYGTKALGAVYGGVTGYLAGGPKEGVMQAASFWSPVTGGVASFVNGYYEAGQKKDATTSSQIWEGAKSAGTEYIIGKVFETGVSVVARGASALFGSESRLFRPLVKPPSQRSRELMDQIRTTRSKLEAEDAVKSFNKLNDELIVLQMDEVANAAQIRSGKDELNQLAAAMNADYHAKWFLKYKADPRVRSSFDRMVQENYGQMIPKMAESLKSRGYDMSDIQFRQFRNASSGGTSSMDLDLAPVSVRTGKEPSYFIKNGKRVDAREFMQDAQQAMNQDYYEMFHLSAKHSEMNLTTSMHAEAFSTPDLLSKDVDFSQLAPEDVASIGKVLDVKVNAIEKNPMLSNTSRMQAKCREASKEIDNMLMKKLEQDLAKAKPGSSEYLQTEADISYWKDLGAKLKNIGTQTNDPGEIIRLNREISHTTGGRDATQVVNDLINRFGFSQVKM